MARSDSNNYVSPNVGLTGLNLQRALANSGVTKVADQAERLALTDLGDATNDVKEWVYQENDRTLWRWTGTAGSRVLTQFYVAPEINFPDVLLTLCEASPTAATIIPRSARALAYPAQQLRGTAIIAVEKSAGYPRVAQETRSDGQVVTHTFDPHYPTLAGDLLIFTLATPLERDANQATTVLRGSVPDDAVINPNVLTTLAASTFTGLTGTPSGWGTAGQFLKTDGSQSEWADLGIADVFGTVAGTLAAGDFLTYSGTGWAYEQKPIGLPTGGNPNDALYRTSSGYQWAPVSGGSGGPSWLPSVLGTAGQELRVNTGATEMEFFTPISPVPAADSITAAMAQLDTSDHRQEWLHRLQIPIHETIGIQDFTVLSGVPTAGGIVGFASTQAGTINGSTSGATFRVGANVYTISQIAQITTAGTNLNNIIVRIGPDPAADVNAEWQFQVGHVLLDFSAATKATVPGNRVTYTWTGNSRLFIGGQTIVCTIRQPSVDIFNTGTINFSQLEGTAAPDQFRDNSIAFGRAIGGGLSDQAGWRTKSGFGTLASEVTASRPLFYVNNQIVQSDISLSFQDLNGWAAGQPTINNLSGQQLMMASRHGVGFFARLPRGLLPTPTGFTAASNAAGQIIEWNGTSWVAITTPSGGTGGVSTFAGLTGRFTWAQGPAVSATDNGKFLGVTGGSLQLYEPALSGFGSGNLPTTRLSGNLSALRVDFAGLTTSQQNAIKSALNITSGSSATIMFSSVGTPELDLYTTGSTASSFTYDQTKREEFIRALGLTRDEGYTRYSGTLTAARTLGGDIGFSASTPTVGSLSGSRNIEIAGSAMRIEAVLYSVTGGNDELSIYFSGTITETPEIILKINGHSFNSADNDTSASDSSYGAAGWVITWEDVPANLLRAPLQYDMEIDGGIEAEIEVEIDAIRQVPALPAGTHKRALTANQDGSGWGNIQSAFQTAEFTSTISAAQRSDQTPQSVTLTALVPNANLFSLSGAVITVQQDGNYNFVVIASPRVSNEGTVQFFIRRGNTDERESIDYFGAESRGQSPGRSVFHMALSRNDRVQLQYIPKEVSPPSSTGAPGPITGATANQYSTGNYTKIAWTGPGTGTYDYVHYRVRPAGQSGTEWGPRQTIYANVNNIRVPWLTDAGVDVEVWLEDTHATTGGFSRTTLYTHSSGAFSTEATRQQTVDVTFDMIIGRSDSVLT